MDRSRQIDEQTVTQRGTLLQLPGARCAAIDQHDQRNLASAFLQLAGCLVGELATVAVSQHHKWAGRHLRADFVNVVRDSIWNAVEHGGLATSPGSLHAVDCSIRTQTVDERSKLGDFT